MSKILNLPVPTVKFHKLAAYPGDLISISQLKNHPLGINDNWGVDWPFTNEWVEEQLPNNNEEISFVPVYKNHNYQYLSDNYVWVVGDSFLDALRPYFNSTFQEIDYLGHWSHKMDQLVEDLKSANKKPDIIFIIRVERSF